MLTDEEIYNFMREVYLPKLKINCTVKAVYLRGSRYVGNFRPDSDWDFTILVERLVFGKGKPSVENYPIDVCLTTKIPLKAKLLWNI